MHILNQKLGLLSICLCLLVMVTFAEAQQSQTGANNETLVNRDNAAAVPTRQVFLLRHFEKQLYEVQSKKEQQHEQDSERKHAKDPELTEQGQSGARSLATFLADKNISMVFSTEYKRTIQTAAPTAVAGGLNITFYDPDALPSFALYLQALHLQSAAANNNGNILVVGHSNTTPQLLKLLGGPDITLSENDYGDLFYLTLSDDKTVAANTFQHVVIK